jgi:hypothetical protein
MKICAAMKLSQTSQAIMALLSLDPPLKSLLSLS